jgi:hypothetical protein
MTTPPASMIVGTSSFDPRMLLLHSWSLMN